MTFPPANITNRKLNYPSLGVFLLMYLFIGLGAGICFGQGLMPPTNGIGKFLNLPTHTNDAHVRITWSEDLTNSVVLVYKSKLLQGPFCLVSTNAATNIEVTMTSPVQEFIIIRAFNTNSPAFKDWTP